MEPNKFFPDSNNSCCTLEFDGNLNDASERLSNCTLSPVENTISSDYGSLDQPSKRMSISRQYQMGRSLCLDYFDSWTEAEQVEFTQNLLDRMCHCQHGQINTVLKPMLQRDFITALPARGLDHIAERILSYLDADSLRAAELVCPQWERVIADGMLWKKLIESQVHCNSLWRGLAERLGWIRFLRVRGSSRHHQHKIPSWPSVVIQPSSSSSLSCSSSSLIYGNPFPDVEYEAREHNFYRNLYPNILVGIQRIEENWRTGRNTLHTIRCHSETSKGVYCLQYDDDKIVSGLRDNTIKVWDRKNLKCRQILTGHSGSVLCLQYDENIIISGSSDTTVRVWSGSTWECLNTLYHHSEAVLHLRFGDGILVSCSKDRSIAVWNMISSSEIQLRRVLWGHRAAVNVVDFDQRYIVSASGDRTIKVWSTSTCEFVRTLNGHKRGIACLQYRDRLVASGSSDNTIRLWDIESGVCLRVLDGHEELVRCIRFDDKHIVSGAYDGKIKVWDLVAALDTRSPPSSLCLQTLSKHTGRVFRLQFDEFQIVSSSHDDTILIWDFVPSTDSDNLGKVQEKCSTSQTDRIQDPQVTG